MARSSNSPGDQLLHIATPAIKARLKYAKHRFHTFCPYSGLGSIILERSKSLHPRKSRVSIAVRLDEVGNPTSCEIANVYQIVRSMVNNSVGSLPSPHLQNILFARRMAWVSLLYRLDCRLIGVHDLFITAWSV